MEYKYSIGEEVRVKNDLITGETYGSGYFFIGGMTKYKGKKMIVKDIESDGYILEKCYLRDEDFLWTEDMLDPYKPLTNYENIINMSIEEMGKNFVITYECPNCCLSYECDECEDFEKCVKEEIDWLNRPIDCKGGRVV